MRSLAIVSAVLFVFVAADYSQEDCQPNEVFLQCGQCEGTCANPRPVCDATCRGRRCECIAAKGYVRSKHGHCIKANECPGPSIYSEDPWKFARPFARVSGIGKNLAEYHDTERDFKIGQNSEGMLGELRYKRFFPAAALQKDRRISAVSGFRRV